MRPRVMAGRESRRIWLEPDGLFDVCHSALSISYLLSAWPLQYGSNRLTMARFVSWAAADISWPTSFWMATPNAIANIPFVLFGSQGIANASGREGAAFHMAKRGGKILQSLVGTAPGDALASRRYGTAGRYFIAGRQKPVDKCIRCHILARPDDTTATANPLGGPRFGGVYHIG